MFDADDKPLRSACELIAGLLVALAGWLGALSPAHAGDRTAAPQTPAALYHNYCSVCHGDAGDGKSRAQGSMVPPPRDFTTASSAQDLTRDRMIAAVKAGVPGTAMTGWKSQLNDKQIGEVVDYVRNTFMRPSVHDASRGRQIYARVCSVCHGDRGAGSMWASANLNPPPRDFSSPQALAELSRDRMIAAVAAGRPNTAMPAYGQKFKPKEIEEVVDYIRSSIMRVDALAGISGTHARGVPVAPPAAAPQAAKPAPVVKADMKLPMPHNLKGDMVAGRKFYDANCATCHGTKGDGQGPRAYFINPKPRVFTSEESRNLFNRPAIYAGVSVGRRGSEMPAWGGVLTPQEMADVSEYVFRSFIQPTAGTDVAKKK